MQNKAIRLSARGKGVPLRLLAEELNISQPTLYRRLNCVLSPDERNRILDAIRAVAERITEEK